MRKDKVNQQAGEILAAMGLAGMGIIGIIVLVFLLLSILMCIPAAILYFLAPFILPLFVVGLEVTFFQCWVFCMVVKIVGGLLFGTRNNSN